MLPSSLLLSGLVSAFFFFSHMKFSIFLLSFPSPTVWPTRAGLLFRPGSETLDFFTTIPPQRLSIPRDANIRSFFSNTSPQTSPAVSSSRRDVELSCGSRTPFLYGRRRAALFLFRPGHLALWTLCRGRSTEPKASFFPR